MVAAPFFVESVELDDSTIAQAPCDVCAAPYIAPCARLRFLPICTDFAVISSTVITANFFNETILL